MYSKKQIDKVAAIIAQFPLIKKIYLFGSYAKGESRENSDIDLAIIKDRIENKHKELFEIRKKLFSNWIPLDLVMLEEKDYLNRKDVWGTIQYEIDKTGVELYGR
jgi:predicted nucleotidyltransferase